MTAAAIEVVWDSSIWKSTTMKGITPNAYAFPATQMSEFEVAKFYHQAEINFFTYLITTGQDFKVASNSSVTQKHYSVEVTYYREQDTTGANWAAVRNAFETLFALVNSALGAKWSNTVDFWRTDEAQPTIEADTLDNRPIWRGSYRFTAEQQI